MSRHRKKTQNLTKNIPAHAKTADRLLAQSSFKNNNSNVNNNSNTRSKYQPKPQQQLLLFKTPADSPDNADTHLSHDLSENHRGDHNLHSDRVKYSANGSEITDTHSAPVKRNNLWLALTFPNIALDALDINEIFSDLKNPSKVAIVVCDDNNRRSPVIACNENASNHELSIGMPLGVAMSICQSLRVIPRDQIAEANFIKLLASEATRLSSQVSIDESTIIIEIGGSLKLYGNLNSLLEHAHDRIGSRASQFQMATATNPAAAAMLSKYDNDIHITDSSQLTSTISLLPISCLSLQPKIHKRLQGMGIDCLGDLLRLPRDGLARRAGIDLIKQLDQLTGKQAKPQLNFQREMSFHQSSDIDYEMENLSAILRVAKPMLDRLSATLRRADASVSRIDWTLQHQSAEPTLIQIKLAEPARDSNYFFELSMNRLQQVQLPERVTDLSLSTSGYSINEPRSLSLFPETLDSAPDSTLVDRLRARLGNHSVKCLVSIDEHRPEYASEYADTAIRTSPTPPAASPLATQIKPDNRDNNRQANPSQPLRPLWLLTKPRKLQTQNGLPVLDGVLRISSNQERIESGWWETHSVRRDYYIAIDVTQLRVWIFRDLNSPDDWYLHGIFG